MSQENSYRNLGASFRSYFEIVPAITSALRDDVYRIRHEVYCEQLGYEPENADRKEQDEYDAHSLHCLMRTSTKPQRLVGCTRLVLTRPDDPDYPLPFERACANAIDRSIIDPAKLPRKSIAEVSRLAVSAEFRRRKGEQQDPVAVSGDNFGTPQQPRFPFIPIGLYLGTVAVAERSGIETMFLLTEPRLLEHFNKLGMQITQIGGAIEHRGMRIPSMMPVASIIKEMRSFVKPLYREICEEIDQALAENKKLSTG